LDEIFQRIFLNPLTLYLLFFVLCSVWYIQEHNILLVLFVRRHISTETDGRDTCKYVAIGKVDYHEILPMSSSTSTLQACAEITSKMLM
jgi:hypothetical protein